MEFSKWVREQRLKRKWTQAYLGEKIGMSQANVSQRELGATEFTKEEKEQLEEIFDVQRDVRAEVSVGNSYTTAEVADKVGVHRTLISSFIHNAVPDEVVFSKEQLGDSKFHVRYNFTEEDVSLFKKINELREEKTLPEIKEMLSGVRDTKQARTLNEASIDLIDLKASGEQVLVSSRDIAKNFNKNHRDVLESVRNLTAENSATKKMYTETTYLNSRMQEYPEYLMNRDGFTLLAMGFTGHEALQWKLKYIEAFNRMEKQLQQSQPSYSIDDPVARAQAWIREQKEKEELQLTTAKQEQIIGELKPSADYTDTILQTTNTLTITQIAKDYDMTAQGMNKLLHKFGIQYKIKGQWVLYQHYQGRGFTKSYTHKYEIGNGQFGSAMSTEWTQKGRLFLYNLLKDEGIIPIIEH